MDEDGAPIEQWETTEPEDVYFDDDRYDRLREAEFDKDSHTHA
jgi:hypothetical protein